MTHAILSASGTAGAQLTTGAGDLLVVSCRESAGTPAVASFVVRDGTDSTGRPLLFLNLAASASQTLQVPPVHYNVGLFLDRTSGESEVVVHIA